MRENFQNKIFENDGRKCYHVKNRWRQIDGGQQSFCFLNDKNDIDWKNVVRYLLIFKLNIC